MKQLVVPSLVEGFVPSAWYVRCTMEGNEVIAEDSAIVFKGTKEGAVAYMEAILNESGMERFQVPGYSGQVFERHPNTCWDLCWEC